MGVICPTGLRAKKSVRPLSAKNNSLSRLTQIKFYTSPSAPARGAVADRHGRGRGMRWTQSVEAQHCADEQRFCGRRSRVVLALRCRRQGRGNPPRTRWQPSMVTEESTKEPLKPLCRNAGCCGVPLVLTACGFFAAQAATGATRIRHSCALFN